MAKKKAAKKKAPFKEVTTGQEQPVKKGIRRSLVMWFGGPPFK